MPHLSRSLLVAFALVATMAFALAPGCTTADETKQTNTTTNPTTGAGGQGGVLTGDIVHMTVQVIHAVSLEPLEGAVVCPLDIPSACGSTDPAGYATVLVLADSDAWVTIELDNYVSAVIGVRTLFDPVLVSTPILPVPIADIISGGAGVTLDPTKGHLVLVSVGPPVGNTYPPKAGMSFALIPPPGQGPFYVNATNTAIDPNLSATGPGGAGLMFNAEPGESTLIATNDAANCEALLAIPKGNKDAYKVRILPNHVTYANILCEDLPPGTGGGGGSATGGTGGVGGAGGAGGSGGTGGAGGSGGTGGAGGN